MPDNNIEEAILAAADSQVPKLKAAVVQAINELRSNLVDVEALSIALSNGDSDAAIAATHVDDIGDLLFGIGMGPNHYVFVETTRNVFALGAITALSALPLEIQTALSYNSLSQRAVDFMLRDGAEMVQEITASTKQAVRSLVSRSLADSVPPAKQVYEIRQLIGLTDSQATAVLNFRRQLETRQILGFTPPDERRLNAVDRSVIRRHMKLGTLSDAEIDKLVEKYYVSLVNRRALNIARTESLNSVNNGQQELWQQARDAGFLNDEEHRQFWLTAGDERVRPTHQSIPAMNPNGVKIGGYFVTPHGLVTGPGTRNSGFISCRCCLIVGKVGDNFN